MANFTEENTSLNKFKVEENLLIELNKSIAVKICQLGGNFLKEVKFKKTKICLEENFKIKWK